MRDSNSSAFYATILIKKSTRTGAFFVRSKPAVARDAVGDLVEDPVQHKHQLVVEVQPVDRLQSTEHKDACRKQNAEQFYQ